MPFKLNKKSNCPLCTNDKCRELDEIIFSRSFTLSQVRARLEEIGLFVSEGEIYHHSKHITPLPTNGSNDLLEQTNLLRDLPVLPSVKISEIIQNTLTLLYARKLTMEINRLTDSSEYFEILNYIHKFSDLEARTTGKIKENEVRITFEDFAKHLPTFSKEVITIATTSNNTNPL